MKWMIASDIHGSARWCREMLAAYDRENADRLLLLGDILYHGPRNALPEEYNPAEAARMLNERKADILCVQGNCDAEIDQVVLAFPIMAQYAYIAEGKTRKLALSESGLRFHSERGFQQGISDAGGRNLRVENAGRRSISCSEAVKNRRRQR